MIEINDSTTFTRNAQLAFTQLDGETVMMSIDNNEYYGLNIVASRIWELLSEAKTYNELINILIAEYDVTAEQCKNDVVALLTAMYSKKMIIVDEPSY